MSGELAALKQDLLSKYPNDNVVKVAETTSELQEAVNTRWNGLVRAKKYQTRDGRNELDWLVTVSHRLGAILIVERAQQPAYA